MPAQDRLFWKTIIQSGQMGKYIVFRADLTEEEGAENRLLAHTGMLTDILAEHFDSSNRPISQPG